MSASATLVYCDCFQGLYFPCLVIVTALKLERSCPPAGWIFQLLVPLYWNDRLRRGWIFFFGSTILILQRPSPAAGCQYNLILERPSPPVSWIYSDNRPLILNHRRQQRAGCSFFDRKNLILEQRSPARGWIFIFLNDFSSGPGGPLVSESASLFQECLCRGPALFVSGPGAFVSGLRVGALLASGPAALLSEPVALCQQLASGPSTPLLCLFSSRSGGQWPRRFVCESVSGPGGPLGVLCVGARAQSGSGAPCVVARPHVSGPPPLSRVGVAAIFSVPALFVRVSGPSAWCLSGLARGTALSVSGPALFVSGPGIVCQGVCGWGSSALSVWGPGVGARRTVSVCASGPGVLRGVGVCVAVSVELPRFLCRGAALLSCVGRGALCQVPAPGGLSQHYLCLFVGSRHLLGGVPAVLPGPFSVRARRSVSRFCVWCSMLCGGARFSPASASRFPVLGALSEMNETMHNLQEDCHFAFPFWSFYFLIDLYFLF